LEQYWNGAILDSVETAVQWAAQMTWKAVAPVVYLVEGIYETGVKVWAEELQSYLPFWQRSEALPKWDITISPT
jgi:Rhodopirellula transposase DDE domain